jgi:ATP-dependent Clp protease protease subunit
MKPTSSLFLLIGLAVSPLLAKEMAAEKPVEAVAESAAPSTESADKQADKDPIRKEADELATLNKLAAERLTKETNEMRAEITRMKMERELLTEKLALEAAKRQSGLQQELAAMQAEKERIEQEALIAKAKAEKLGHDLKIAQTESSIAIGRLQNELSSIETKEKREAYADMPPVYLKNPLREDKVLVVSDRRIPLNGVITSATADFITERIQYWNNKNRELPIFIVIDSSPGGSVMAGYRILKSMESSDAPVHVVVKSFAASMAAAITTLAKESYAYPNAVILHHQISIMAFGQLNLTQQKEMHEESNRWWARFGTPIANKMGITPDELIKRMYARSSSGDWTEFATDAQKLKWVNHVVEGIDETSVVKNPDAQKAAPPSVAIPMRPTALAEEVDADGKPFAWLPRLQPKDVYFLYNPDGYYRLR